MVKVMEKQQRFTLSSRKRAQGTPAMLGIAVVLTLLLAACTNVTIERPALKETGTPQLPADVPLTLYQSGAAFTGGEVSRLSDLLVVGRPVVLNFWAGLCPPCRMEMPDLQAVHERFQGEVLLFGLDVGPFTALGTREDGMRLLEELAVTYPAGTTSESGVVQAYGITGMPSTLFITPDGRIVQRWTGLLTEAKLTELVQELLKESSGS